jgi:prolipoprotein diacylglyceryl transferase
VRKHGANVALFMDAVAPALLVAQAVGRIGNYFNKELFGGPTTLPWGLEIPVAYRPAGYAGYSTFQPTFLYELIFNLALAALLVWLGHHRSIKPPGLFALYVAGYSAFRIFEEALRVDPSEHFLGLRLNMYVAAVLTIVGIVWFWRSHRRRPAPATPDGPTTGPAAPGTDAAAPATDAAAPGADADADAAGAAAGDATRRST